MLYNVVLVSAMEQLRSVIFRLIDREREREIGFPDGSVVKNLSAMQETLVPSLDWEDPLEEGMATHSSTLA